MHDTLSLGERERERRKTSKQVSEYKYGEKIEFYGKSEIKLQTRESLILIIRSRTGNLARRTPEIDLGRKGH